MSGGDRGGDGGGRSSVELLTVAEYAARHGKTPQAVYKWIKSGLIDAVGEGNRNRRINPATEDPKLARRRTSIGHGGERRNSGRPGSRAMAATESSGSSHSSGSSVDADQDDVPVAAKAAMPARDPAGIFATELTPEAAETLEQVQSRESPPAGALGFDDLYKLTHAELRVLALLPTRTSGFSENDVARLRALEEYRRRAVENEERAGSLVNAADVAERFRAHLAVVRQQFEAVSSRVARPLSERLWLSADDRDQVLDLLKASGVHRDTVDAVGALLVKPVDLEDVVRREVATWVAKACEAIAMAGDPGPDQDPVEAGSAADGTGLGSAG